MSLTVNTIAGGLIFLAIVLFAIAALIKLARKLKGNKEEDTDLNLTPQELQFVLSEAMKKSALATEPKANNYNAFLKRIIQSRIEGKQAPVLNLPNARIQGTPQPALKLPLIKEKGTKKQQREKLESVAELIQKAEQGNKAAIEELADLKVFY